MVSEDALYRFLAAVSATAGAVVMMTRSTPSWDTVLIGSSCLLGWALFMGAPREKKPTLANPVQGAPIPAAQPERSAKDPPGAPRALPRGVATAPTQLPEVPSHRQRVVDRQSLRSG